MRTYESGTAGQLCDPAKTFNQQTNVSLDNKYIVLDISELTGDLLTVGMFMALDFVWDKSISSLTLSEAAEFGNVDCTATVTAFRDGKEIGTLNTELILHTAYLWPKEVQ